MKKIKFKAVATALLVSVSLSAAVIPSYAAKIGEGLTLPEDGVVAYDFNTDENPFEEHVTGGNVETANGASNIAFAETDGTTSSVFKIGKGNRNIYTPKNWETDYVKKSMSVRINNSGIKATGNNSWQRIILWYEDETDWLGLDWKISDSKDSSIGDYTYDTRIVAMNSNLTSKANSTEPNVLEKWQDLKNSGKKMPVGERSDWVHLDVTYTEQGKMSLSWYKENDPDNKYTNSSITTSGFTAYDISTLSTVDASKYFANYDLRKGLFGIAGVNYDTNVGYYDDLTVTLDVDSATVLKFKSDNADALALTADGFYDQFKTDYSAYTTNIAKVKAAYTAYSALSDDAKSQLTSEIALLNELLFVEKKADTYMGKDISVDFEDGLSADKYIELLSEYSGETGGRENLAVVSNPSKVGNESENVVQLARDGWAGSSNMIHKIKLTDVNSSNYLETVSFKMYYNGYQASGKSTRFYLNYSDDKDISKTDYLSFFSDGTDANMQFYVDKYNNETSNYDRNWSSSISGDKTALGLMQKQWYTVNIKYTAAGVAITIINAAGECTGTFNVAVNNPEKSKVFVIGVPQFATGLYDDFKVTFRCPYSMAMTEGAWLRNDATPGIRFGAQNISESELYNANDCTVVAAGALFMPYDKLEDGEQLTVERADVKNVNGAKALKAESATDTMPKNIYGVLANVIENDKIDKNRDFVCRTYIKYTKAGDPAGTFRYAYADADNENMKRSLNTVVLAAAKDLADYNGTVYDDAVSALKSKGYLGGNK